MPGKPAAGAYPGVKLACKRYLKAHISPYIRRTVSATHWQPGFYTQPRLWPLFPLATPGFVARQEWSEIPHDSELHTALAGDIADAVRLVSGYTAAVAFLVSNDETFMAPAACRADALELPGPAAAELVESESPAAMASLHGSTLVFGPDGIPCDALPEWARLYGTRAAMVLPGIHRNRLLGAVYALRRDPHEATLDEIHLAELAVSHGAKALAAARPPVTDGQPDLAGFLHPDAGGMVRDLAPLSFAGVRLDPVREQVEVDGVSVSLSRTEFIMLYTLAQQPDSIVPHHVLLEACWQEDVPALSAVDATVYRLRKKLAHAPGGRKLVKTVRGQGYALRPATQPV